MRTASEWQRLAANRSVGVRRLLERVYGTDTPTIEDRCRRLASMAERYALSFGDGPVVVARAPGRVNLMGRHVDHQGGHCNMMAIEPDVYVMAGLGPPGLLRLRNLASDRFADADVRLDSMLEGYNGEQWADYVASERVRERARKAAGAWYYYLLAALARLTAECPEVAPRGLQAVAAGNVPVAAGLSSSSALVVASMEALCGLAGIELPPEEFVQLCAEAEWYVGTRGGAGDQAAMKYGRQGCVVQLSFHPLQVGETAPWPEDYALLVAHSGQEARKSGHARDVFNQRVACYHIGREMVTRRFPELRRRVQHLRDLTPLTLDRPDEDVARLVRALPEKLAREQVSDAVGPDMADLLLSTHNCGDAPYPIRGVVLFGLAECERSRRCIRLLQQRDMAAVGRYMRISHDGDRVSSHDGSWPWADGKPYDDPAMDELIQRCAAGQLLSEEPGAYACSTADIDAMVDMLLRVPGVLGAQLSGAGLGGSMMALMHLSALDTAQKTLKREYYDIRGLSPVMLVCRPVAGCGVLQL